MEQHISDDIINTTDLSFNEDGTVTVYYTPVRPLELINMTFKIENKSPQLPEHLFYIEE